jgi:hypothetical protein
MISKYIFNFKRTAYVSTFLYSFVGMFSPNIAVLSSYTALPDYIEVETKKETNEDMFYLCLNEIQALGETSEPGGNILNSLIQTLNPLPKWAKLTSVIINTLFILIYINILSI